MTKQTDKRSDTETKKNTVLDRTRQDKTKQHKTRQDKTKQEKTTILTVPRSVVG